ncbi:MAG: hypothetical protein GY828_06040 [Candidatus Gracilibacteria bacterium]|nr:hypothetical protein [Candidatus Gracilibacteria bacterium]
MNKKDKINSTNCVYASECSTPDGCESCVLNRGENSTESKEEQEGVFAWIKMKVSVVMNYKKEKEKEEHKNECFSECQDIINTVIDIIDYLDYEKEKAYLEKIDKILKEIEKRIYELCKNIQTLDTENLNLIKVQLKTIENKIKIVNKRSIEVDRIQKKFVKMNQENAGKVFEKMRADKVKFNKEHAKQKGYGKGMNF